jgi:hypothetical protein
LLLALAACLSGSPVDHINVVPFATTCNPSCSLIGGVYVGCSAVADYSFAYCTCDALFTGSDTSGLCTPDPALIPVTCLTGNVADCPDREGYVKFCYGEFCEYLLIAPTSTPSLSPTQSPSSSRTPSPSMSLTPSRSRDPTPSSSFVPTIPASASPTVPAVESLTPTPSMLPSQSSTQATQTTTTTTGGSTTTGTTTGGGTTAGTGGIGGNININIDVDGGAASGRSSGVTVIQSAEEEEEEQWISGWWWFFGLCMLLLAFLAIGACIMINSSRLSRQPTQRRMGKAV